MPMLRLEYGKRYFAYCVGEVIAPFYYAKFMCNFFWRLMCNFFG